MTPRERVFVAGMVTGALLLSALWATFSQPEWWMVPAWVLGIWLAFSALRWWMRPWR